MPNVRLVRAIHTKGGKKLNIKRAHLTRLIKESLVEATADQMRVMAEESRELIIDKLMAAAPQMPVVLAAADVPPPEPTLKRPERLRRADMLRKEDPRPFNHKRLRERTIKRKLRLGLDLRKLLETGDYIRGIEVFKGAVKPAGVYYMVRPAPRKHKGHGWEKRRDLVSLATIARVHEFGSAKHNIPKRPHWGPVSRAVIRQLDYMSRKVLAEPLRRALRKVR